MYDWFKALHVIAVIAWMAGMLYLPRLFVYHAGAAPGSEASETFKVMERRLLRAIITPASIAALVFGLVVLFHGEWWRFGWMHAKLTLVLAMFAVHGFLARTVRAFAADENRRSARFYKFVNEVPTVLMILIVLLVVLKPF
ncbi:protoporphyrinogen oxidase HemJ [Chelatococcus reniformis]|uniref:Protoporphyrinogen IX oxidase n=1 Tax=Chelatococcus reniformis TaxID=1494448 RepID=A0A916TYM0_9HYPH|nr:protoporphyrinogen oxidase HemJ [Chelatococcus reniformis]GGC51603.1 membrane protein [Chelatococcus reniformis]